jgi:hypothetical protein
MQMIVMNTLDSVIQFFSDIFGWVIDKLGSFCGTMGLIIIVLGIVLFLYLKKKKQK